MAKPLWKTKEGQFQPVAQENQIQMIILTVPHSFNFTRESIEDGFLYDKENGIFRLSDWEKVG